ncbi:metallophosphoesterase [Undibacterium sp.]|uniref:metallophosphoesterase family protein n=1 Tax=Undibacterium sp. TaxID=1914977 RepID=UPI0025EB4DCD|nr:metallophosphoesterase [Undibacterium sp.]
MKETLILHISDLHFGSGFSKEKWSQISGLCEKKETAPDLVIITGDVVNHPFRYRLKKAKAGLDELQKTFQVCLNREIPFVYVPGNHDARIFGLFPLYWLFFLSLFVAGISYFIYGQFLEKQSPLLGLLIFLTVFIPIIVRYVFFTENLEKIFGNMLLVEPTEYSDLNVGVIPLDSSKALTYGAHGRVKQDMVTPLQKAFNKPGSEKLFWIAAVHHHPLPIPSDDFAERSMILKNAGTVLKNLIHHQVPLILHGHKHHQHFARFFLAPRDNQEREISVLSAGTPTHSRHPNRPHSFNIIRVSQNRTAVAIVFEGEENVAFVERSRYEISSSNFQAQRNFDAAKNQVSVFAEQLVNVVSIDEFGSAIWAEEFNCLDVKENIVELPYNFKFVSRVGHISAGVGTCVNGSNATTNIQYVDKHSVETVVKFNPQLIPGKRDFSYRLEFKIRNFCALDSIQFEQMYAKLSEYSANVESMLVTLPENIAIGKYVFSIKFPDGFKLPKFWVYRASGPNTEDWQEVQNVEIISIFASSTIMVVVDGPNPNSVYKFAWNVPYVEDKISAQSKLFESALASVGSKVLQISQREEEQQREAVKECLENILTAAEESFIKKNAIHQEYRSTVSIFAYDSDEQFLRKVAGIGDDKMRGTGFRYGLGLPGIALKSRRTIFSDKSWYQKYKNIKKSASLALDDNFEDISNESMNGIAVPLYCKDDCIKDKSDVTLMGRPYGVVKISYSGHDFENGFDFSNGLAQSTFSVVVSNLMHDLMEGTILK